MSTSLGACLARVTKPARIGDKLSQVDTPAIVVRLDALKKNLNSMKDYVQMQSTELSRQILLRPHAKTHKCPAIAKMQVDLYGAVGICCQKLDEAEAMIYFGVTDIFLTNEVVGEKKISRLCELARTGSFNSLFIVDVLLHIS